MRKLILALFLFMLMPAMVLGATVSRELPQKVSPEETINVKLTISSISISEEVKTFAIEESLPPGFTMSEWSITGSNETKDNILTDFSGSDYKFEFTPTGTSAVLTYTTEAPADKGDYTFKATWFDLGGMSGADDGKSTLTVRVVTCGDNVCEENENSDNCEVDCPKPVVEQEEPETTVEQGEEVAEGPKSNLKVIVGVAVILMIIAGIIISKFWKKKEEKIEDKP